MTLQAGEMYRMRNGEIVGPLRLKDYKSKFMFETAEKTNALSWDADGEWNEDDEYEKDIVEHIPKESPKENIMNEKLITVNLADSYIKNTKVTLAEAERLGAEAKRIREENEIKEGDWFLAVGSIRFCTANISEMLYDKGACGWHKSLCKKITNPDHIKTLNEIYEANK